MKLLQSAATAAGQAPYMFSAHCNKRLIACKTMLIRTYWGAAHTWRRRQAQDHDVAHAGAEGIAERAHDDTGEACAYGNSDVA